MIRINIICIGKIKEKYFTDAISEYAKRLTAFCKFAVVELAEEKIRNNKRKIHRSSLHNRLWTYVPSF